MQYAQTWLCVVYFRNQNGGHDAGFDVDLKSKTDYVLVIWDAICSYVIMSSVF